MNYRVTHTTRYSYTEAVPVCQNQVHLAPRVTSHQRPRRHRLRVNPTPADRGSRLDYFGNQLDYFSIQQSHATLTVEATTEVEVLPVEPLDRTSGPSWKEAVDWLASHHTRTALDARQFCFDSPMVPGSEGLADYARPVFATGKPLAEAVWDLTCKIHDEFSYDPRATTTHTPLSDVLAGRRGVCQDFAHVQLGCLRSMGLAARYVSGYLRTEPPKGKPRLVGADASHAWISVFCPVRGWIDLDPTNRVSVGEDHVTLAWGRDYSDVCPIQGVFVGGGQHTMTVEVDVAPL